jgi:hypothetical protein
MRQGWDGWNKCCHVTLCWPVPLATHMQVGPGKQDFMHMVTATADVPGAPAFVAVRLHSALTASAAQAVLCHVLAWWFRRSMRLCIHASMLVVHFAAQPCSPDAVPSVRDADPWLRQWLCLPLEAV